MGAVEQLRKATAVDHEAVDAAFAGHDLTDRASYGRFLTAHARALPAVEAALDGAEGLPAMRPRAGLLAGDLAALGLTFPSPFDYDLPDRNPASAFGAAYVIEGSRLGGGLLGRRVGSGLPSAYLSSIHLPGEWRGFLTALDAAVDGEAAVEAAVKAARSVFALYRRAAMG